MADNRPTSPDSNALEGWKAIAAYLNRDVRTAKRWETSEALPVRRHQHAARSSVYAYPAELDAWREGRRPELRKPPTFRTRGLRYAVLAPLMLATVATSGGDRVRPAGPQPTLAATKEAFRKVWDGTGAVSLDGRLAVFVDRTGNLVLHDIATSAERPLTVGASWAGSWAASPAVSRDGRRVAYWWMNLATPGDGRAEIRVLPLDSQSPEPQVVLRIDADAYPRDWSPDGQWIALSGTTSVDLVAVASGTHRVLRELPGRPTGVFFSPDGRSLAFDAPVQADSDQHDVFVTAIDGLQTTSVVTHPAHDVLAGWSSDGSRLLFTSDRSGSGALWAIAMPAGSPAQMPALIRPGIGAATPLGVGAGDRLFLQLGFADRDVRVAALDVTTGRATAPVSRPIQQFVGVNSRPAWSRDGRWLAYVSERGRDFEIIVVLEIETGETRELRPNLVAVRGLSWSPDGRSLVFAGSAVDDRGELFRADLRDGRLMPLGTTTPSRHYVAFSPQWSPDGRRLYFQQPDQNGRRIVVERDMASGRERVIAPPDDLDWDIGGTSLSPDGLWIALVKNRRSLVVVPVSGGIAREILTIAHPDYIRWQKLAWTPDMRSLLFMRQTNGTAELWAASLDDGTGRRLDVDVRHIMGPLFSDIAMHPDGQRIAFAADETRGEVWVLEEFLPAVR